MDENSQTPAQDNTEAGKENEASNIQDPNAEKATSTSSEEGGAAAAEGTEDEKQADGKTEDGKPGEEGKESDGPPEKYDLKLPDGSALDPARVEEIVSYARERGFSNDVAQEILTREHEVLNAYIEANKPGGEDWNKRLDEWEAAALANKEIGGSQENLKKSAELGRRAIEKFFPESIQKFLQESGFGSHPDVLVGFARIGKALQDDSLVKAGSAGASQKTREQIFYGDKT